MKFIIIVLLFTSLYSNAQDLIAKKIAKNTIFAEYAFDIADIVHNDLFSINYDRLVIKKGLFKFNTRIGISLIDAGSDVTGFESNFPAFYFPLTLYGLVGKKSHNLELGFGNLLLYDHNKTSTGRRGFTTQPIITTGYRFQRPQGGLFFRIVIRPIDYFFNTKTFGGGLSIGYTFKTR